MMKNYFRKILITGGNGQIAYALRSHPSTKKFNLTACDRNDLDITRPDSIEKSIDEFSPNIIINTAAYTTVDKAEADADIALLVNHFGPKHLALACTRKKIPLIHLSTDYVFDGKKSKPYAEDDLTNPLNVYGKSKWLGEESIREHCDEHIILRTSSVFSNHGNNFFKTILRLADEKKELKIVSDQTSCPTYAMHVADVIYKMITNLKTWGTYHYCDTPAVTWYEFATKIIYEAKKSQSLMVEKIESISADGYHAAAKRPAYSVLDCSKLKMDYGISQGDWRKEIKELFDVVTG